MYRDIHLFAQNDKYEIKLESVSTSEADDTQIFLHCEVFEWNKTTLSMIREELEALLERGYELGYDRLSFYLPKDIGTKFHNLVRPLDYELEMVGNENYLVAGWFTD